MNTLDERFGAAAQDDIRTGLAPARCAADWLSLAAAPTFAMMALLAGISGGGPGDTLCAALRDAPLPGGMVPMYVLMSAFHLAPWLKLIPAQRRRDSFGARVERSESRG